MKVMQGCSWNAARRLVSDSAEPLMRYALERSEKEVPGDVHRGMDQCGGENRAGLAPSPAVEKAGDGGQDHVAPIGKAHVGDVGKAKDNRGDPPTDGITGSADAAEKQEGCERDVDAEEHRENISKVATRERPEPMR